MTDILSIIPQRPPFVMIDKLLEANESVSRTSFTIPETYLFVENGFFTEPGLVENMAQSAAAGNGYIAMQAGDSVTRGYIGALKNVIINELPKAGDTIITEVSFLHRVMNAQIVQARILLGETEIASCELKVFIEQAA